MFVRNEGKYCRLYNVPCPTGTVVDLTDEQVAGIQYLVDSGDFTVHKKHPNPPKSARRAKPAKKAASAPPKKG
jgi:hypothetical protein